MTVLYNSQETTWYLEHSFYVTKINFVTVEKEQWENISYYEVTCAGKKFNLKVEEPVEAEIEYCVVEVNYEGRDMFRGNIRELPNFFNIVGKTLTVFS